MRLQSLVLSLLAFTLPLARAFPFPFPVPQPAPVAAPRIGDTPTPTFTPALGKDDLTNGERLARGLPPKAPVKRFDASKTGALRPRQSGGGGGDVNFHLQVSNATDNSIIGLMSYDVGNGALFLPVSDSVPVVFTTLTSRPPLTETTIWARNSYIDTTAPVVTRDWTNKGQSMGYGGHLTCVFGAASAELGESADNGDQAAHYAETGHQSSIFDIPSVPGRLGVSFFNPTPAGAGTVARPDFYLDRSDRRVLRIAGDPQDIRFGLDEIDEVYIDAIPVE